MSDESQREEAYLNKMMTRNQRNSNAKKNVFGGGLEAARAKETKPVTTAQPKPTSYGAQFGGLEAARIQAGITKPTPTTTAPTTRVSSQQTAYVPPPIEAEEVVELSLPPPSSYQPKSFIAPPLESEVVELSLPPPSAHINDKGLVADDEEAARREAERMAKSVGRFHLGAKPTGTTTAPSKPVSTPSAPTHVSRGSSRQRKDWELPPTVAQYNTKFENFLLAEIVLARNSPDLITDRLRERRNLYRGNDFVHPEFGTVMTTHEGVQGVNDAIKYLENLHPLKNKLKLEDGLSMSARDFCDIARNTTQPNETDEQAANRLSRYGEYSGALSQNVAFSNVPPSDLILDWIIDDGQAAHGRPHRHAIFDPSMNVVGIASGPHSIGRVICVVFTNSYHVLSEEVIEMSLPVPGGPTTLPAPTSTVKHGHGEGYVYPDFQVGGLIPADNNTANILPISSLACDVSELYLGIRQNGKAIEFRRTVTQNGKPRKEIQTFNLPYPVSSKTAAANYYPNKNGGELAIRLGKQLANDGGFTLEFELARFTVLAHPGTTSTRVQIGLEQLEDHYVFAPGPASQYNTDFVVVLNGNALEFRSTYSYQEGDSVKTVNGKQTVQLPVPPTLDQIDIVGSAITIWPNRKKGAEEIVHDSDIVIHVR